MRPYAAKNYKEIGHKREHRLLAETALGKTVPEGADVHHFNGTMNGGQLVICESHEYHHLLHVRQRAYTACGHPAWRKCTFCKQWDNPDAMISRKDRPTQFIHRTCRDKKNKKYYDTHYLPKRAALAVCITCADTCHDEEKL